MKKITVKRMAAVLVCTGVLTQTAVSSPSVRVFAAYENTHVNTGNQREDIVAVAETQIGYHEGASNETKYSHWLGPIDGYPVNGYGYPWCHTFVSWCANQAGIPKTVVPYTAGTVVGRQFFINDDVALWEVSAAYDPDSDYYIPQRGDIIYFGEGSSPCHVGIVTDCDGGTVCTVEGNSSDQVIRRSYSLTDSGIIGYGVPDYEGEILPDPGHVMNEEEAAGRTIPDGEYYIGTALSEYLFLDINGVGAAPSGTEVFFWNCDEGTMPTVYDIWTVTYLNNGFYRIKQRCSDVCLEVADASLAYDANVRVFDNNGTVAQQWSIAETDTGYELKARCNSFCLDVCGAQPVNGANAMTHIQNNDPNQRFTFIPCDTDDRPVADGIYMILASGNTAFSLDGSGQPKDYKAGTNVALWNGANELFRFRYTGGGWYEITEYYSGLALDVDNSGHQNYADKCRNIMLHTPNGGNNQRWRIVKNSNGTYTFISRISGYALDLYGNDLRNGGNISQHFRNQSAAQCWKLTQRTFTLKVDPNGGTYGGSTTAVTKDPKLIFGTGNWWNIGGSSNAVRKGYTLTGYFDAKTGGTKVYDAEGVSAETIYFKDKTYVSLSDLVVYAQWQANEYTVTFNSCGGTTAASKKVKMDAQYGKLPESAQEGYTFAGWYTAVENGTEVKESTVFRDAANKTLYAHWIPVVNDDITTTTETTTTETTTTEATTTETTSSPATEAAANLPGDVDGSGDVNVADAVLLARFLAEDAEVSVSAQGKVNADINGDSEINCEDLTVLLEILADIRSQG